LRSSGVKGSNAALNALARKLNAELAAEGPPAQALMNVNRDPSEASQSAGT
jgi:hypothetical protein